MTSPAQSSGDGGDRRPAANVTGIDAYAPAEIAARIEKAGIVKAGLAADKLIVLGLLAGIFIAFGGAFFTLTITDSTLGFEHCVANFYLIPVGLLAGANGSLVDAAGNIVSVTLGNVVGGAGGVAAIYWLIYGRKAG